MEVQVKELIKSIQKDGIEAAEKQSGEIVDKAKKEAEQIVSKAKKEAERILADAGKEVERLRLSSTASLEQSARDVLLSLEQKIRKVLDAALFTEVTKNMSGKVLAGCITDVVKSDLVETGAVALELSEKDASQILEGLKKSLEKELAAGLEIKPIASAQGGFIIRQKDGKAYYDFSVKEIAANVVRLVNPYVAEVIQNAVKGA